MTGLLQSLDAALVERVGWTLLHSVWQIGLFSIAYGAVILTVRRSASIRYVTGCVVLTAMLLAPLVTFVVQECDASTGDSLEANTALVVRRETQPVSTQRVADSIPQSEQNSVTSSMEDVENRSSERPAVTHRLLDDTSVDRPGSGIPASADATSVASTELTLAERLNAAAADSFGPWLPHICAGWCCGVLLLWLRLAFGVCTVRKLRSAGRSPVPESVETLFRSVVERVGVSRGVAIAQSTLVQIPSVVGVLRPVILLPVSAVTGLTPDQLEVVLAHELAHVRRYDFLANVLQTVVESLLFYHPCMWWVSCCLRQERENCSDDFALRICSDRSHYARTLMAVEELCGPAPQMLVAANGGSLVRRIRRIAGTESARNSTPAAGIVAVALLLISAATFVYAQNSVGENSESTSTESASATAQLTKDETDVREAWETFIDHLDAARYQPAAVQIKPEKVTREQLSVEFRRRTQALPRLAETWRDRFGSIKVLRPIREAHAAEKLAAVVTRARRIDGPETRMVVIFERRADRWQIRQTDDHNEEIPLSHFVALLEEQLDQPVSDESRQTASTKELNLPVAVSVEEAITEDATTAETTTAVLEVGRTIETSLGSLNPSLGEDASLDVERALTIPTPSFPSDPESDFNSRRHGVWKWALRQGVDFAGNFETGLLATVQRIAQLDEGVAPDRLTLESATEIMNRSRGERSWTTLIPRSSREDYVFRTHHGSVGIVRITGVDERTRRLKLRFKLLSRAETGTPRAVVTQWLNAVRDLNDVQSTWGLAAPTMRTLGAIDQVNSHLWNRAQLHPARALGNDQTQLVVTNTIKDNSGRDRVILFQVLKHDGQWLLNEAYLYEPDETETLLWGFSRNPGMVWDVRESDVIGEWVHQFFVLTANITIRPDHTLLENHDGEQSTGTWKLDGNQLTFMFDGSEPSPLTVTHLGPNSFSFTNPEGSKSTYRRQKPLNGLKPTRKVTLTDFDEAASFEVFDFDTEELIAANGRVEQWTDEMKRGDLVVEYAQDRWSLGTLGMTVAQLPDRFWKASAGREFVKQFREALSFPGPFPTVDSGGLTFHQLRKPLQFPMIVGFSTQDETLGMIRIIREYQEPRQLVFEYRLVGSDDDEKRIATGEDLTGHAAVTSTDTAREARELALIEFVREAFGANDDVARDAAFTFAMTELHEKTLESLPTLLVENSPLDKLSFTEALQQLEEASRELPLLQATVIKLHRKHPLSGVRLLVATRLLNVALTPQSADQTAPATTTAEKEEVSVPNEERANTGAETADSEKKPDLPAPTEAIVLDPNYLWRTSHCAVGQHTDYVWEERDGRFPIFSVGEPLRRHVWNRVEFMPVDPERYPILVLTYRAENLSKADRPLDYILWFSDSQGGSQGGITAVMNSDLIDDGKLREVRVDVRNLKPRGAKKLAGPLDDMWLGLKADADVTGESPARFEFAGLRFEKGDAERGPRINRESKPIKVRVVDFHGRPVSGAKVITDAQRINFAHWALSDRDGRTQFRALENEVDMHMLRVEKEGWCTAEIPNVADSLEEPGFGGIAAVLGLEEPVSDEVRVVLHPAQRLTGKVVNEDGDPIANASVELRVPALDNLYSGAAEIINKVKLRTDENGIWKSPPLPSNGASVDIELSHPDYVDDPRSRDFPTDDVSLKSIRNGDLVLTMYRGATLSAKVTTFEGAPADGTKLLIQTDHGSVRSFVDDKGRLEIHGVPTGTYHMLLTRNGHAPQLTEHTAKPSANDLGEIKLQKGRKVTGRVRDASGEPVAGARVEVVNWRKRRILKRSVKTSEDGVWTLSNMPLDEFTIRAKLGGRSCEVQTVPEDTGTITLTLR